MLWASEFQYKWWLMCLLYSQIGVAVELGVNPFQFLFANIHFFGFGKLIFLHESSDS